MSGVVKMLSKNSAIGIARYFVWKSQKEGKPITNKKLQKLLYYSQAWSLVLKGKPLFKEDIEAWIHGPVVASVYDVYKQYGFNPIQQKIAAGDLKSVPSKDLLDDIWKVYGKYDGNYLEILTHNEEPWQKAREQVEQNEASKSVISHDDMKEYYSKLLRQIT